MKMTKDEYTEFTNNYIRFMNNPANIINCSECPERQEHPSWETPYPCGQQHCWVLLHVQASYEE